MTISSRTPEGTPHRCPVYGNGLRGEFISDTPFSQKRWSSHSEGLRVATLLVVFLNGCTRKETSRAQVTPECKVNTVVRDWVRGMPPDQLPAGEDPSIRHFDSTEEWITWGKANIKELEAELLNFLEAERNEGIRSNAVRARSFVGTEKSVDPLIRHLKEDHCLVQTQATVALGKLKAVRAVKPLCAAAQSTSVNVRANACNALGWIGVLDPDVEAVLEAAAEDTDYLVRACAADALKLLRQARSGRRSQD
jgi:hypothetical protein